jgi:hypothetical protein
LPKTCHNIAYNIIIKDRFRRITDKINQSKKLNYVHTQYINAKEVFSIIEIITSNHLGSKQTIFIKKILRRFKISTYNDGEEQFTINFDYSRIIDNYPLNFRIFKTS